MMGKLTAGAGLVVMLVSLAPSARAGSVWPSDCSGAANQVSSYNPGDQVCASGDVDVVPPGEICGAGDLYVIPRDYADPFADVTMGGANYFSTCLGAGGYIDQSVWLPILKPGQYEIVLDQYPFHDPDNAPFDPAVDVRGAYFTVADVPPVLSCDPAAIKAAALAAAAEGAGIQRTVELIKAIKLLGEIVEADGPGELAYTLFCEALDEAESPIGCPEMPWDWTEGKAIDLLDGLGKSIEHQYLDIAADPPDPDFLNPVPIDMSDPLEAHRPWSAPGGDDFSKHVATVAQLLALESSAYRAFLPSFEKEQGARAAGDHQGLVIQTEKMIAYLDLAKSAGDHLSQEADTLSGMIASNPDLQTTIDGAMWQSKLDGVAANGLSQNDQNFLRSFGLSDADVMQAQQLVATYDTDAKLPDTVSYQTLLDALKQQHAMMMSAVADLRSQADAVRQENDPYALMTGPQVTIAQPAAGTVGTPVAITATATHYDPNAQLTYAWDTNLDGNFDDGTGATLQFTPTAPIQIVVVKVSDGMGRFDVAFTQVDATATNAPPVIDKLTPGDVAPFADPMQAIPFHVDAHDPDGDPLAITWTVDGMQAGSGADFSFTMPDDNAHQVVATVADTDPYSADANAGVVVRASKWDSGVGSGSGGLGGSGSGDGAMGKGGGCCEVGTATPGQAAGVALLVGLVAFGFGRRRRR
jgi:hypothetical protein